MEQIDKKYAKEKLSLIERDDNAYKNNFGHVLVIAGSYGMAGAAAMSGLAALRSGAGLLTYAVPKEIVNVLQMIVPEAMCIIRNVNNIDLDKYNTIIFGPGIGVNNEIKSLLEWVLNNYKGSLLIDADGLNVIANYNLRNILINSKAQIVITPHMGEAKRLLRAVMNKTKMSFDKDDETYVENELIEFSSRKKLAKKLSKEYECTVVLKGHGTLVCKKNIQTKKEFKTNNGINKKMNKTKKILIMKNTTGNPGMATAGSGDVLSGVIGGLLSQKLEVFEAACLGVFLHGRAGDKAANFLGQRQMIARDIIDML